VARWGSRLGTARRRRDARRMAVLLCRPEQSRGGERKERKGERIERKERAGLKIYNFLKFSCGSSKIFEYESGSKFQTLQLSFQAEVHLSYSSEDNSNF
jgi:hypothetical protein